MIWITSSSSGSVIRTSVLTVNPISLILAMVWRRARQISQTVPPETFPPSEACLHEQEDCLSVSLCPWRRYGNKQKTILLQEYFHFWDWRTICVSLTAPNKLLNLFLDRNQPSIRRNAIATVTCLKSTRYAPLDELRPDTLNGIYQNRKGPSP